MKITKKQYLFGWHNPKMGGLTCLLGFKTDDPTYLLLGETEITIEAPDDWEEQVKALAISEIKELRAKLEELEAMEAQDVS